MATQSLERMKTMSAKGSGHEEDLATRSMMVSDDENHTLGAINTKQLNSTAINGDPS
jgi:hypothetical protein